MYCKHYLKCKSIQWSFDNPYLNNLKPASSNLLLKFEDEFLNLAIWFSMCCLSPHTTLLFLLHKCLRCCRTQNFFRSSMYSYIYYIQISSKNYIGHTKTQYGSIALKNPNFPEIWTMLDLKEFGFLRFHPISNCCLTITEQL